MSMLSSLLARTRRLRLPPAVVGILIVVCAFLATLFARQRGLFQFLEFQAYDLAIRHQPKAPNSDPVVLVEFTESDIHSPSLDYPLYDDKLAELLARIQAGQPAAVGLDIWRDIPVPKNGSGIQAFNDVLLTNLNIVPIFTTDGIQAPAILRTNYDRVAFNDNFQVDWEVDHTIPKVRRTVIFSGSASGQMYECLPYKLAILYLERHGIEPQPDPEDPRAFHLGKAHFKPFKPDDGAYVAADAKGWQMILDYKCPEKFTRYTVTDVLEGRVPADRFRDRIVLVGVNSPSVSDERVSPIRRDHRGVELQAMTVNQLVRQAINGEHPISVWPESLERLWILLWCAAGGAIAHWVRSPLRFALLTVTCLVAIPVIWWKAFLGGLWIPVVAPAAAYVPAALAIISYASAQERSMRAVLMKLYSRHVSKEIAEAVWENRESFLQGHRPLAQKLTVTVLFTDLKGFSTISERMGPAKLYEWLNGYLGAMAQVIQAHGGVLKQFTGDGVLALFGVPVPHTTREEQSGDANAAVRCALAMGERLIQLSQEWTQAGLPLVSMRAGIHTGEVAAGSIGSDDRFEYAVIGDVVNTASRLESYDKNFADPDKLPNRCRILIGAPTHELLAPGFESREIGLLEVKGKANLVPVFQVLGFREAAKP